jgi:hypothetical protein
VRSKSEQLVEMERENYRLRRENQRLIALCEQAIESVRMAQAKLSRRQGSRRAPSDDAK